MPPKPKKDQDQTPKALLREKLFVPCEYVTEKHLKAWTAFVPDPDKPDTEDKIELQLYKDLGSVYAFCSGDLAKVRKHFSPPEFKVIDKRVSPPMDFPITMHTALYTPETDPQGAERNQREVADEWIRFGYGQIMAPARFGKTITITDIVAQLGLKTLILSHQWDILDQFEKTIREHTDVEAIEKMAGRKLVARLDKWDWSALES